MQSFLFRKITYEELLLDEIQTFITGGSNVEYNREHWEAIEIWFKQGGYLVGNPYLIALG